MFYFEYPPEINELINEGAGLGIFYPKIYSFAASSKMTPTGAYNTGSGNSSLTNSNSTSPRYISTITRPGEYFWATSIYCSYCSTPGGPVSGPPTLSFNCSDGKKFIDSFQNQNFGQLQDYNSLPNVGGPGYIDGINQASLWYPAPFRYCFSEYTTITCEIVHPGGNPMDVYITLCGFAQEKK